MGVSSHIFLHNLIIPGLEILPGVVPAEAHGVLCPCSAQPRAAAGPHSIPQSLHFLPGQGILLSDASGNSPRL